MFVYITSFLRILDRALPAACVATIATKFRTEQDVPGEDRAVPADAETVRVDTAGSAQADAALHVAVEAEEPTSGNSGAFESAQSSMHHPLRATDEDALIGTGVFSGHEIGHESMVAC